MGEGGEGGYRGRGGKWGIEGGEGEGRERAIEAYDVVVNYNGSLLLLLLFLSVPWRRALLFSIANKFHNWLLYHYR